MHPIDPMHSVAGLCTTQVWTAPSLIRRLYMPLGWMLACLRLVSLVIVCLLAWPLPQAFKRMIYLALLCILGIKIKRNLSLQAIEKLTDGRVIALNHLSVYDYFPLLAMPSAVGTMFDVSHPLIKAMFSLLSKCSGKCFWNVSDMRELATNLRAFRKAPQGTALYVAPEATINNGSGLFAFRPNLLNRGFLVVPLAMRLNLPLGLIAAPLHASAAGNFFRLLMMPWLSFELTYLPAQQRQEHQSPEAFAHQIQTCIAVELGVAATPWSREDKHAYRQACSGSRS
jgi:hypothetical protein